MKLLGQLAPGSPSSPGITVPHARDEHPTYREVFVPPETSIVQLILEKVGGGWREKRRESGIGDRVGDEGEGVAASGGSDGMGCYC